MLYNVERRILKINKFIQLGRMQGRYKLPMLHLQKHFGDAYYSGRCLQMPYVALDRANCTAFVLDMLSTESIAQSGYFDWIAQLGAGTMRFNVPDTRGSNVSFLQS